jgi:mRNA interferase MazF
MANTNQFDIHWADLDPTRGSEIQKTRPCIVVSPNEMNDVLKTVVVVPLTKTIINWPFRVTVNTDNQTVSAACDQVRTIAKERLGGKLSSISPTEQEHITDVLQAMFSRPTG